jgi:predicted phosphohydrolase
LTIWGISDLHLSFARPEPRERFAARWRDHAIRIEQGWRGSVAPDDLVLLPGDFSMARNHRELQLDLEWLHRLPGTKVLSAGNHDRWWNDVESVRRMLRTSTRAVGGDAIETQGVIVCGTLGAPACDDEPPPLEQARAARELTLLERALQTANELRSHSQPLYVLWHYPPFDAHRRPAPCVDLFESFGATACAYGHLHIEAQWSLAVQGEVRGVRYHCVAADAVGFRPLKLDRV